jgi:hypothetical protein
MARCGAGSRSNLVSAASQHEEGRDENILFEDAGMHDEERRRRAGGRRRQGWPVGQHEPRQAERRTPGLGQ